MDINNLDITTYQYRTGAKLVLIRDTSYNSVHVQVVVNSGSTQDPIGKAGMAHFVEHAIYKGNSKYSALEFNREIGKRGIHSNAYTSHGCTVHWMHGTSNNLKFMIDTLLHAVFDPTFDKKEIEIEKEVVLNEFGYRFSDISLANLDNLMSRLAKGSKHKALFRSIIGIRDQVASITAKDIAKWHKEKYVGSNVTITIVGNFDSEEQVIDTVTTVAPYQLFHAYDGAHEPANKDVVIPKVDEIEYHPTQSTSCVYLGWRIPGIQNDIGLEYFAGDIFENVVMYGPLSRFYNRIREKHGISYDVGGNTFRDQKEGYMFVGGTTDAENLELLKNLMTKCFKNITEAEVKRSKNYVISTIAMRFDSLQGIANLLASDIAAGRDPAMIGNTLKDINNVTLDDVAELADIASTEPVCSYIINRDIPTASKSK